MCCCYSAECSLFTNLIKVYSLNVDPKYNFLVSSLSNISFADPSANIFPFATIYPLSIILSVSLALWSVIIIPSPLFFKPFMIFVISLIDIGSIPANGSSSKRNFGFVAIALAISTFLRSPPDKD